MKRMIFTGLLALAVGVGGLHAQKGKQAPAGQQAQAAPAAPAGPAPKSAEEAKAIQALIAAQQSGDPDAVAKSADELLTKYADTDFKELALTLQANAYQMKNDDLKAQVAWGRVIQVNPKNVQANLALGGLIIKGTGEKDLDRDEKIASAEKHLNAVLDIVKNGPKPNPQLADADWAAMGQSFAAEVHNNFGGIAIIQAGAHKDDAKKYWDTAVKEFQTAVEMDPTQAAYQAKLASTLLSAGRNAEAITACDKALATPNLHPQIKGFLDKVRASAVKASEAK